jgi:hypothetical protein
MTASRDLIGGLRSFVLAVALLAPGLSSAVAQQQSAGTLNTQQIEQLVAPIALYPDSLLSQVLMASTYPLEVVEAARWVKENPNVKGQALEDAMQKQSWDPSVKALTAVPQTLAMMNDELKWTQDLGDAFLAQQSDVLDAVQRLRARADAAGNLRSTPQQRVARTRRPVGAPASAPATVYTIEPATPDEYFVPIYDPGVVYGAWPYEAYWPFYWHPPGYVASGILGFATGVVVGAAIWGSVNWWDRRVDINVNRYNRFNRTNITNDNWQHNPAHRHSVAYGNANVAKQFGDKGRDQAREAFRGKQQAGQRDLAKGGKQALGGKGGADKQAFTGKGAQGKQAAKARTAAAKSGGMAAGMATGMGGKQTARAKQGGASREAARQRAGAQRPTAMRQQSMGGGMGGGGRAATVGLGGGAMRAGMAGGFHGGGMMGGGRGGRRSDIELKHDIALIGTLDNGLGFYRFAYLGSDTAYVGVMAQEVQRVRPDAVVRGRDGYLRVFYDKLGLPFQTYEQWLAAGAQIPSVEER